MDGSGGARLILVEEESPELSSARELRAQAAALLHDKEAHKRMIEQKSAALDLSLLNITTQESVRRDIAATISAAQAEIEDARRALQAAEKVLQAAQLPSPIREEWLRIHAEDAELREVNKLLTAEVGILRAENAQYAEQNAELVSQLATKDADNLRLTSEVKTLRGEAAAARLAVEQASRRAAAAPTPSRATPAVPAAAGVRRGDTDNGNTGGASFVPNLPSGRCSTGTAVCQGALFVTGGYSGSSYLDDVLRYSSESGQWTNVRPLPVAMRQHACVAHDDGMLYVTGGNNDSSFTSFSTAYAYNLTTDRWSAIAQMGSRRHGHGSVSLDGFVYVIGGYDGGEFLSSAERYTPSTGQWEAIAPMRTSRFGVACAVLDGRIYAVGGYSSGTFHKSVERYDPATNTWERVNPMANAREWHACGVLNGSLYAISGISGKSGASLASMERYDLATRTWVEAEAVLNPRRHAGCVMLQGQLLILGGFRDSQALSAVDVVAGRGR